MMRRFEMIQGMNQYSFIDFICENFVPLYDTFGEDQKWSVRNSLKKWLDEQIPSYHGCMGCPSAPAECAEYESFCYVGKTPTGNAYCPDAFMPQAVYCNRYNKGENI